MASELLSKANDEFVNENYERATQLYAEALELEKRDDIYCNRAQAYIKLEKYKEAVDDCNQAVALNANNSKAQFRKGIALFHLEDYRIAKEAFTQGQTLDPADSNFPTWIRKCEAEIDCDDLRSVGSGYLFFQYGFSVSWKPAVNAKKLYAEALELEKRDDIYCNRAQAYIKLEKYKEAVDDCNQAVALNANNSKAQFRKGIALFHLEDYRIAKEAFTQGQTLDPADSNFPTWIRKCEAEIDLLKQDSKDSDEIKIGSSGGDSKMEDSQKDTKKEQTTDTPKSQPQTMPMPSKEKSRYDWYQTQTHVIVTVMLKNVKQEDMTVDIQERSLSACIKLPSGSDYTLELDLSHPIDPKQSQTKLLKSKIEVKLKKCEEIQWQKLEGEEPQKISRIKVETPDPKKYPTSSHYTRNWDKLASEVAEEEKTEKKEGDAALNELFQKIYADGSDETRRAMMKSFYESGGTVLSTNWSEVGKEKVEVKPPDGMEFKKWET